MKALTKLSNIEKARIIFQLFPEVISEVLEMQKAIADNLDRDPHQLMEDWHSDMFTPDFWVSLARQSKIVIEKYGYKLSKNSRLFSDQLFDGYNALFSMYCMKVFAKRNNEKTKRFSLIVDAVF